MYLQNTYLNIKYTAEITVSNFILAQCESEADCNAVTTCVDGYCKTSKSNVNENNCICYIFLLRHKLINYLLPLKIHLGLELPYIESIGACRDGLSPQNNAGSSLFSDRNCKLRCTQAIRCTGYTLPVLDGSNWCSTHTSYEAIGNGNDYFTCHMKTIGMVKIEKALSNFHKIQGLSV